MCVCVCMRVNQGYCSLWWQCRCACVHVCVWIREIAACGVGVCVCVHVCVLHKDTVADGNGVCVCVCVCMCVTQGYCRLWWRCSFPWAARHWRWFPRAVRGGVACGRSGEPRSASTRSGPRSCTRYCPDWDLDPARTRDAPSSEACVSCSRTLQEKRNAAVNNM